MSTAALSTATDATTVAPCRTAVELPAELTDQLADLIVFAPDPAGRAAVIAALVTELQALVTWRETVPDHSESTGISRIVAAAEAHLHQMQSMSRISR